MLVQIGGNMNKKYANPETKKIEEFAAFDVLRFLLAATVLLSHMNTFTWAKSGELSVQVFFALSGWLIGGILYDTKTKELGRFFYNRFTRIWIPYFFTISMIYLVSLIKEPMSGRWFEFLIYDLTFTHNWFTLTPDPQTAFTQMPLDGTGNHFWSIAVEEQFYLIAPLILVLLPFGKKIGLWVLLASAALIAGSQYGAISLGVLASVIYKQHGSWHLNKYGFAGLMVMVALAVGLMVVPNHKDAYLHVAPLFAISIVLLCARPMKRTSITKWIGGVSFPLYLNAWIGTFALNVIFKYLHIGHAWYTQPLHFMAGLAAATVTYQLIDVQVMKHRNRYFSPNRGWMFGLTAYFFICFGIGFYFSK
jgi:peptidoglycan/LPS O-acetylase OafA/YrhL